MGRRLGGIMGTRGGQGGVGDGEEGFELLGEGLGAAKGGCVGGEWG